MVKNKNTEDQLKFYKNNVFPTNIIKIIFSKRKDLTIDKFRNEYLMKLENILI